MPGPRLSMGVACCYSLAPKRAIYFFTGQDVIIQDVSANANRAGAGREQNGVGGCGFVPPSPVKASFSFRLRVKNRMPELSSKRKTIPKPICVQY